MVRSRGSGGIRYRLQYRYTVRTRISIIITIGPSLTGLRGTQLASSISYTLVSNLQVYKFNYKILKVCKFKNMQSNIHVSHFCVNTYFKVFLKTYIAELTKYLNMIFENIHSQMYMFSFFENIYSQNLQVFKYDSCMFVG
jgi:hypothetical protein